MDISNPSSPKLMNKYETPGDVVDVAVSENYAYVADAWNGLMVMDITDPSAPTLVGSCDTDGAYTIAVSGNYTYVSSDSGIIILKTEVISTEGDNLNISIQANDSSAKTTAEIPTETVEIPPEELAEKTSGFGFLLAVTAIGGALFLVKRKG